MYSQIVFRTFIPILVFSLIISMCSSQILDDANHTAQKNLVRFTMDGLKYRIVVQANNLTGSTIHFVSMAPPGSPGQLLEFKLDCVGEQALTEMCSKEDINDALTLKVNAYIGVPLALELLRSLNKEASKYSNITKFFLCNTPSEHPSSPCVVDAEMIFSSFRFLLSNIRPIVRTFGDYNVGQCELTGLTDFHQIEAVTATRDDNSNTKSTSGWGLPTGFTDFHQKEAVSATVNSNFKTKSTFGVEFPKVTCSCEFNVTKLEARVKENEKKLGTVGAMLRSLL